MTEPSETGGPHCEGCGRTDGYNGEYGYHCWRCDGPVNTTKLRGEWSARTWYGKLRFVPVLAGAAIASFVFLVVALFQIARNRLSPEVYNDDGGE